MCGKSRLRDILFWILVLHLYAVDGQLLYNENSNPQTEKLAAQFLKSEIQHMAQNIERNVMQTLEGVQNMMEQKISKAIDQIQKEKLETESVIVRNLSRAIAEQQDLIKAAKTQYPSDVSDKRGMMDTIRDIMVTVKSIERIVQGVDPIKQSLDNLTTEVENGNSQRRNMVNLLSHVNRSLNDVKTRQRGLKDELVTVLTNVSDKVDSSNVNNIELMKAIDGLAVEMRLIGEFNNSGSINFPDINFLIGNLSSLTNPPENFQTELSMLNSNIASMLEFKNQTDFTKKVTEKLTMINEKLQSVDEIDETLSNLTDLFELERSTRENLLVVVRNMTRLLSDVKNKQVSISDEMNDLKMNQSFAAELNRLKNMVDDLIVKITGNYNNISKSACNNSCEAMEKTMTGTDCADILKKFPETKDKNGTYDITTSQKRVYCDMTTDKGGWTVIQQRIDGSIEFYRNWSEYRNGFGNLDGNHWIGLEALHSLTSKKTYELRVDMQRFNGDKAYAKYSTFSVGDEADKYDMKVSGYSGNAGDSMTYSNGMKFSTLDRDNDKDSGNCATYWKSAWWFKSCFYTNPNGQYTTSEKSDWKYVVWYHWKKKNMSLKYIKFMIRPRN